MFRRGAEALDLIETKESPSGLSRAWIYGYRNPTVYRPTVRNRMVAWCTGFGCLDCAARIVCGFRAPTYIAGNRRASIERQGPLGRSNHDADGVASSPLRSLEWLLSVVGHNTTPPPACCHSSKMMLKATPAVVKSRQGC